VLALSGRLVRRGGGPIAGAPVTLQAIGDARPLATVTTDGDGRFAATVVPGRSMLVRAVYARRPAAVSALVAVERVAQSSRAGTPNAAR
jgi:hypothetical protein